MAFLASSFNKARLRFNVRYIVQCRTPLKLHQPRIPGEQIIIAEAIAGILRRPQQFINHQVLSWDGTEATQHQFEVILAIASLPNQHSPVCQVSIKVCHLSPPPVVDFLAIPQFNHRLAQRLSPHNF